jgi:2-polyprenyl-3-methyl-5-hydroxy-6-metoxy-1,4-benzoquinol methylase
MADVQGAVTAVEAGNFYDKYATRNPVERRMVAGFLGAVRELAARSGAAEAHEVGCGEGELAIALARGGMRVRGSDLSAEVVAEARERAAAAGVAIDFRAAGIEAMAPDRDAAELIVCCEVLEHVPDPVAAVDILAGLARPWLLASVPREPLWRALNMARGKYVRDLGNTPGHLNHFSRREFYALLARRFEIVEVRSPLPWSMALCRAREA